MAMYRSILVPLDGSSFGEHALPLALSLAGRAGAHLHLAHVHQAFRLASDNTVDEEQRAAEGAYFDGLLRRLQASCDVPITTKLLDGPIAQALRDYAVERQANLIVMTTHGRGALSRVWLGSIADTLMRSVSVPVLLVRPQEPPPDIAHEPAIHHILVPLDGSPLAEQILVHATELGRITQAEYTLLQVVEPLFVGYGPEMSAITADEQILESLQAQAQEYLDRVATQLRAEGLQVQATTVIEFAVAAILDYAREHAVDLIALETQGRGGLARWIVGGVADKVIRGASVPVLLHRPQGGGEQAP
jgi:nucleotide-binding universal stress UspA family protein